MDLLLLDPQRFGIKRPTREMQNRIKLMRFKGQIHGIAGSSQYLCKVVGMVFFGPGLPVLYQVVGDPKENCNDIIKLQCLPGIHFNALTFIDDDNGMKYVPIILNAVWLLLAHRSSIVKLSTTLVYFVLG